MPRNVRLTAEEVSAFAAEHGLPASFRDSALLHYRAIAGWLRDRKPAGRPLLVGINGAQGSGKTTLAAFLRRALEYDCDLRALVLSLDDFYLSRDERRRLAEDVHPLLRTRGVPGTHNTTRLAETLESLRCADAGSTIRIPRFDKATDDQMTDAHWRRVRGPVDIVLFEGWCVGTPPQPADRLMQPINELEKYEDPDSVWRRYVNYRLAGDYAAIFANLNVLLFMQVPSFAAVYRWRREQEDRLRASLDDARTAETLSERELRRFILHFERLTSHALDSLVSVADVVIELDEDHACRRCHYRAPDGGQKG